MNELLARACDVFVAPSVERRAAPAAVRAPRPVTSIAVLGPSADAAALAMVMARRLRREAGTRVAIVASWEASVARRHAPAAAAAAPEEHAADADRAGPAGGVALPAANALARRLVARAIPARATGRLVRLSLPADPSLCIATLARARAASEDAAIVTLLRGPLADWMLAVLAEHDRVLVHLPAQAPRELDAARHVRPRRGGDPGDAGALDARAAQPCADRPRTSPGAAGANARRGGRAMTAQAGERGQAAVLLLGVMLAVCTATLAWAALGSGRVAEGGAQKAADLAALAGARTMHANYPRVFAPAVIAGRAEPVLHVTRRLRGAGEVAAERTARANGAAAVKVRFPDATASSSRCRSDVEVSGEVDVELGGGAAR